MSTLFNPRSYYRFAAVLLPWLLNPLAWAGQIDSASYFHLRRGMSESEVLLRVGEPDRITGLHAVGSQSPPAVNYHDYSAVDLEIKQFHYIPDAQESDPHLTVISFRGGLVSRIERSKVFSRLKPVEPDGIRRPLTTQEVRREQADRVLDAAKEYAEIRRRLQRQGNVPNGDADGGAPLEGNGRD